MPLAQHPRLRSRREFGSRSTDRARVCCRNWLAAIPEGFITGPPFIHIQGFSSYTEGFAAEAGFPITRLVKRGPVRSRTIPTGMPSKR